MSPKLTFMLPLEIIQFVIVPFLPIKDVVSVQRSCKEWKEMNVWEAILKRDFGKKVKKDAKEEYKLLRICYISDERIRKVCKKHGKDFRTTKGLLECMGWKGEKWDAGLLIEHIRLELMEYIRKESCSSKNFQMRDHFLHRLQKESF